MSLAAAANTGLPLVSSLTFGLTLIRPTGFVILRERSDEKQKSSDFAMMEQSSSLAQKSAGR